jgi:hypothetical protein
MQVQVQTPDGQMLVVAVPDGLQPGHVFRVAYTPQTTQQPPAPTPRTFEVAVPVGLSGGMQVQVQTPDGQTALVAVPDGLQSGQSFSVQY